MDRWQRLGVVAASGSALLLLGALAFQHLGGLAPCKMCLWQRWPHGVTVVAGLLLVTRPDRRLLWIGFLAALTTAGLGIYHAGVELSWWPGPSTCTGGAAAGLSVDELFDQIMAAPLVRCDEVPWAMLGISMAGWNALISSVLSLLWLRALRAE